MVTLVVTFDTATSVVPTDTVDLFWNVNAKGIASGSIDESAPINGSPIPLFPGGVTSVTWGNGNWGMNPWGTTVGDPDVSYTTPAVCFGAVQIEGKARDSLGNYQATAPTAATQVVNSPPVAPEDFTRGSFNATTSVLTFTFTPSPQLAA